MVLPGVCLSGKAEGEGIPPHLAHVIDDEQHADCRGPDPEIHVLAGGGEQSEWIKFNTTFTTTRVV